MKVFWPEAQGKIHIDAWREVTEQDGYAVRIINKKADLKNAPKLFFINLGGYKKGAFEEYHYKMLTIAKNSAVAIKKAKKVSFYKHTGFTGATSHIDDKYGIDVDDVYVLEDILAPVFKKKYAIVLEPKQQASDKMNLGYLKIEKIKNSY